ncbi:MAG TPA: aldose epimerase family protein [Asticcacaulis sp.]|nr:aldose epimerase family protein [Asticcacaulis sp.]
MFRKIGSLFLLLAAAASAEAGTVEREPFGVTQDGKPVDKITLRNDRGMSVSLLTYGGIITDIRVPDRAGHIDNVVLTLADLKAHEARPNFSSLIGRYANRISGGGFTLDGQRFDLVSKADGIATHGGPKSFGSQVWAATDVRQGTAPGVTLSLISPDGDNGFPGKLTVEVRYSLDNDNRLHLDYTARTTKPTVINFTHHAFFNLSGAPSVRCQTLRVAADAYLPVNSQKLPATGPMSVNGTAFDLRQPKRLAKVIAAADPQIVQAKGLDHNFVLSKAQPGELTEAAVLSDDATGRRLRILTTEPGLQVYTTGPFNGSLIDVNGHPLQSGAGVALEPQHYPDSPHHPDFPSTRLNPGETFHSTSIYAFDVMPGKPDPAACD